MILAKTSYILVALASLLIGAGLTYLYFSQQFIYQGKTTKQWAELANKYAQQSLSHPSCDEILKGNYSDVARKAALTFSGCVVPTDVPSITLTPTVNPTNYNPHAGMKEMKGTNCSGQIGTNGGKDTNMDCQPYDYWYYPKSTPQTDATGIVGGNP